MDTLTQCFTIFFKTRNKFLNIWVNLKSTTVCHVFRLTKQDDDFGVTFDHFWSERRSLDSWDSIENWTQSET